MAKPKPLPKKGKIAEVQAFDQLGFSVREIARIMNIDKDTVMRYQKTELNEAEWGQFADAIKHVFLQQDFELAQLAVEKIKEKIDRAKFFELVGLLKTVRELNNKGIAVTIDNSKHQTNNFNLTKKDLERILEPVE